MRSEGFPNKRVIEDDANEAEAGRVENVDHSNEDHFQQGKELIAVCTHMCLRQDT